MQVKITAPFFFQNRWFFEGDEVEGPTAEAAVKEGCADKPKTTKKTKANKVAPENKADG